jgi:hypothetical protein
VSDSFRQSPIAQLEIPSSLGSCKLAPCNVAEDRLADGRRCDHAGIARASGTLKDEGAPP